MDCLHTCMSAITGVRRGSRSDGRARELKDLGDYPRSIRPPKFDGRRTLAMRQPRLKKETTWM
jgi:hypothetical protein